MTKPDTPPAGSKLILPKIPPIITESRHLLSRYDVLYCDVWGVVHDGHTAYPGANDALPRFRKNGGTVILVSNAPVPATRVERMLEMRGVSRDAWDAIVSSGAIALEHVARQKYRGVYYIGPRERDAAFFDKSPAKAVALADAEAIVCTGLEDDVNETAETYRPILEAARLRNLPFVCANPDLVVDVGGKHFVCAGALADLYEHLGGPVYWAGKPHLSAYETALVEAQRLRDADVSPDRILAIGDALRTDIKGAHLAGIDALFVAGGIHRHDVMTGHEIDPERLASLFHAEVPPAIAATPHLVW